MNRILAAFSLKHEKEVFEDVIEGVEKGVAFSGTNLWILVFAIFIASLGLNVNSTAVVIGAMLVSPLMGPIMGLGMGMATNDLALLKKALANYAFATGVGLATSTIFFLLSPISDASSEILARTSPNIYDVLIALFGGLAGILAMSSRQKGNVLPGVAIATALMPPLCTAGYGIANLNFAYFSGAMYLFVINTVFIALATLVTARFLQFPRKHLENPQDEIFAKRIVWGVVIITLLPSIYFGYDVVRQNQYTQQANRFVETEAVFPNDYLLKKTIDAQARSISLTYGGELITEDKIEELRSRLPIYGLDGSTLEIKQGFAILNGSKEDEKTNQINNVLAEKDRELRSLRDQIADGDALKALGQQIFKELNAQYPTLSSCAVQPMPTSDETGQTLTWIAVISSEIEIPQSDRKRIAEFLKARINSEEVKTFFEVVVKKP